MAESLPLEVELPESLVKQLEARAARNGRSLEDEVGAILQAAVFQESKAEFLKAAAAMRARLAGGHHTETLELLREDRDR